MTMTATETITLGRKDYGWGVTAEVVEVMGDVFAKRGTAYFSACGDCSPEWSGSKSYYAHVLSGVCFACNGRGWFKRYDSLAAVEKLVKGREARERARVRREAAKDAEFAAAKATWFAANPELAEKLTAVAAEAFGDEDTDAANAAFKKWGSFVSDLAAQAVFRGLSEAQTEAVTKALAEVEAREAAKAERSEASRYWMQAKVAGATGTVKVRHVYESDWGSGVMLVIEGTGEFAGMTFKTSGTGATLWATGRGDEVEVAGTVKARDEYEGTKQTVLTRAKIKVTKEAEQE